MKRYPLIPNFDGSKFAARYGLNSLAGDFYVDGDRMLVVPDSLPDNPIQEECDPRPPSIISEIDSLPGNLPVALKNILKRLANGR